MEKNAMMKIDGGCHCGTLKFEAVLGTNRFSICHCRDCQKMTGSAFSAVILIPIEDFCLLSGTPQIYVKKTADSGRENISAFCSVCGTRIYSCAVKAPTEVRVRIGTINQRSALEPEFQIWRNSALSWVDDLGNIQAFDKGRQSTKSR